MVTPKLCPTPGAQRQEEKAGAEQQRQAGQPSPIFFTPSAQVLVAKDHSLLKGVKKIFG